MQRTEGAKILTINQSSEFKNLEKKALASISFGKFKDDDWLKFFEHSVFRVKNSPLFKPLVFRISISFDLL